MIEDALRDLKSANDKAVEALRRDLSKLRTGRAHPAMLDNVRVDYYGQITPIPQMATVSVPEPRLLMVKAWDKSQTLAIAKALRESDLGLNPQVDGEFIRVPVPPLSEERRRDLVKLAKKQGEECKIAPRHARHEAMDMLLVIKDEAHASEDEVDRAKKKAEEIVSAAGHLVDQTIAAKEKEILAV